MIYKSLNTSVSNECTNIIMFTCIIYIFYEIYDARSIIDDRVNIETTFLTTNTLYYYIETN